MYFAPDKKTALKAYDKFVELYNAKYPKATACLEKDSDQLFTFYDFPAIHWQHIRTTNPIESTFATVRLRTKKTKGCGSVETTLTMVFKLTREAEKSWRKLRGYRMVPIVMAGEKFIDGEPENANLKKLAA
jgi:transposase-like protein